MKALFHLPFTSRFGFDTSSKLTLLSLLPKGISSPFSCATSPRLAQVPSAKASVQECSFCWCAGSARVTQIHRAGAHRCLMPALKISDSGPGDDLSPSLIIPRKADEWGSSNWPPQTFKPRLNRDFSQQAKLRSSPPRHEHLLSLTFAARHGHQELPWKATLSGCPAWSTSRSLVSPFC